MPHGLKDVDLQMLSDLDALMLKTYFDHERIHPFSFQVVLTKADMTLKSKAPVSTAVFASHIAEFAPRCMPNQIVTSTTTTTSTGGVYGMDQLRLCIAEAGGFI